MIDRSTRLLAGAALFTLLALNSGALRSQSRETLETEVTASNNEVVFKWSKKHPWDAELVARGASLWAEYRTTRGVGLECLNPNTAEAAVRGGRGMAMGGCFSGTNVMRTEDRTIRFKLSDALTAEPNGPVCLQLRLADQRVLPIRRATREGGDTSRFQYETWSKNAALRSRLAALEIRRRAIQEAIATQATEVSEQDASNVSNKWQSVEACSSVANAVVDIERSNRPIIPPLKQDEIARTMCVIRLANGGSRVSRANSPPDVLFLLNGVDAATLDRWRAVRGAQLTQFVEDWPRLSPGIAALKKAPPPFGAYDDYLDLQSLTAAAGRRVLAARKAGTPTDAKDILGFVGGTIEAYDRCVRDGKRQLELNYQEAEALKTAVKTLPDRIRAQDIKTCQDAVGRLDSMRARLVGYQRDLATLEKEISGVTFTSPSRGNVNLNAVACTP